METWDVGAKKSSSSFSAYNEWHLPLCILYALAKLLQSCPTLCDPVDYKLPGCPLSIEFTAPGDLPKPGIELTSFMYPALAVGSLSLAPLGSLCLLYASIHFLILFIHSIFMHLDIC